MYPALILASASPRRRELLGLLGLPFCVSAAELDERPLDGEDPAQTALRLSLAKAQAVASARHEGWIVASDTIVVLSGRALGKPSGPEEAVAMLRALRHKPHLVYSGLALLDAANGRCEADLAETRVWMRDYDDEEIARYVASGDPLDKAGAYAIQNRSFHLVAAVEGCYANVMGFPLCHLYRLLVRWGRQPEHTPVERCQEFTGYPCRVYKDILA